MTSLSINQGTPITGPPTLNLVSTQTKSKRLSYQKCEKIWGYTGKISRLTRNVLNSIAVDTKTAAKIGIKNTYKIFKFTSHMKFLDILGLPFSFVNMKSSAQKLLKSIWLNDKEGVTLGLLSATSISLDTIDSITTFVNTSLKAASKTPIRLFSIIGLPLGFTLTGIGIISRTAQMIKTYQLSRNIKLELKLLTQHPNQSSLKAFLEKTLGTDNELNGIGNNIKDPKTILKFEKLKERKKAALLRAAPKEVLDELEKIFENIKTSSGTTLNNVKLNEITTSLSKIQKTLRKTTRLNLINQLSSFITLSALILFAIGTAGVAPFILLVIAIAIKLGTGVYEDVYKENKKNQTITHKTVAS